MSLAEQWDEIERGLPADWADARLNLKLDDPRQADRAAALLGPPNPGRRNGELRFYTARRGAGPAPRLPGPARARGHVPGGDAGARLVRRRPVGVSADPVSWLVVEPGWKVVDRDGDALGRVDEVIGDTGQDIFNGLAVSQGMLRKRC